MASVSPGKMLRGCRGFDDPYPGAFDALAGKMIERAGFRAMYLSGAAFSAGALALPDIGLFTLSELVTETTRLTRATTIPLDRRCGYRFRRGGQRRADRHRADRRRRGGHSARRSAAAEALRPSVGQEPGRAGRNGREDSRRRGGARSSDTVILARTDARGVSGMNEALDRAKRLSGCWSGLDFSRGAGQRRASSSNSPARFRAPLVANMTEFGQKPALAARGIETDGLCRRAVACHAVTRGDEGRQRSTLAEIAGAGTQQKLLDRMQSRQELYDLLGYTGYEARDRAYFQHEANS